MTDVPPPDLRAAARELADNGLCVLPVVPYTSERAKQPPFPWTAYKAAPSTPTEHAAWFDGRYPGIGIVYGAVSGNIELVEFEGRAIAEGVLDEVTEIMEASGLGDTWRAILGGWVTESPSGGRHFRVRVDDGPVPGNLKLASRLAREDEYTDEERQRLREKPNSRLPVRTLIETRGEGGFGVVEPSHGAVHETGRPYVRLAGGPATIPTVTADVMNTIRDVCRMVDTVPVPDVPKYTPKPAPPLPDGGLRPGEDYNHRGNWADILRGIFRPLLTRGHTTYWGWADGAPGVKATTGRDPEKDRLYVFTTSSEFEPEVPYSKFAAHAHLNHGGDYSAAARELRRQGYGTPAPVTPARRQHLTAVPEPRPAVDGTAALDVNEPEPGADDAAFSYTDDGNALHLVAAYGDRIRYCTDRAKWLIWNGTVWTWAPSSGGTVREYAKALARELPVDVKAAAKHRSYSLSARGTTAALLQASTDPRITVEFDQLDAYPWDLNTPGGIVDLRTGSLGPHDPARLHTRITLCTPDPDADPRRWREFLHDTFGDDTQLVDYLQRLVGYSATGTVGRHVLPFAHGSGGNGKGVFLEAVSGVLGGYATTSPNGFLMAQTYAGHETEIARLSGARMVLCSEVNQDDQFDEAKVKQLTGGDTLTARFMRQDHFTFTPTHHLWLMGNHQPQVSAGGDSFWRRLRLIPFLRTVPPDRIVDDLQSILRRDHGPAILAWIVEGAAAYHRDGLKEPDSVLAATQAYASEEDHLSRFLNQTCVRSADERTETKILRAAYDRWCQDEGETALKAQMFGRELKKHGITRRDSNGRAYYVGLSLLTPVRGAR